jgi:TolB protein
MSRHKCFRAAAIAAALTAVALPASASAQTDERVVYVSDESGNYEIYSVATDGTDKRRLTNTPEDELDPAGSPDGTRIAFTRVHTNGNRDIWTMDRDGGNELRLTSAPRSDRFPAWSPNGELIAFRSNRSPSTSFNIWLMNANGASETLVTFDPKWADSFETAPTWAPDNEHLTFVSDADGNQELYEINAIDGSGATRRITNNPAADHSPAYSPDGERIAFVREIGHDIEVFSLRASDGGDEQNLTNAKRADRYPAWSPDGTRIAFRSSRDLKLGVWTMNADGSNPARLTDALGHELKPTFLAALPTPPAPPGDPGTPSGPGEPSEPGAGPELVLTLRVPTAQRVIRNRGVRAFVRCNLVCPVNVRGRLVVPGTKRKVKLAGAPRLLRANRRKRVKLWLPPGRRLKAKRMMASGKRMQARVTAKAPGIPAAKVRVRVRR